MIKKKKLMEALIGDDKDTQIAALEEALTELKGGRILVDKVANEFRFYKVVEATVEIGRVIEHELLAAASMGKLLQKALEHKTPFPKHVVVPKEACKIDAESNSLYLDVEEEEVTVAILGATNRHRTYDTKRPPFCTVSSALLPGTDIEQALSDLAEFCTPPEGFTLIVLDHGPSQWTDDKFLKCQAWVNCLCLKGEWAYDPVDYGFHRVEKKA